MRNFKVDQVDEVVHGRVRLGVMAYLSSHGAANFTELRDQLGVADGALSIHLRKLQGAGYVAIRKGFMGVRPQTRVTLTAEGVRAWADYLEAIDALVGR